jgi:hypothetical protein
MDDDMDGPTPPEANPNAEPRRKPTPTEDALMRKFVNRVEPKQEPKSTDIIRDSV